MATDAIGTAEGSGRGLANAAVAKQEELAAFSFEANTAMAWHQLAIALAGKITGR